MKLHKFCPGAITRFVLSFGLLAARVASLSKSQTAFSAGDLARFYSLLTNRQNHVIPEHELGVALAHPRFGSNEVRVSISPLTLDTNEHLKVYDEAKRQLQSVLRERNDSGDRQK